MFDGFRQLEPGAVESLGDFFTLYIGYIWGKDEGQLRVGMASATGGAGRRFSPTSSFL
jgi:hypothetical protein